MPKIIVYTKPSCVQCGAVKRWLDKRGLSYETVDLTADQDALDRFKAMNLMQAPIVEIEGFEPFTGFNPLLLEEYILGVKPIPSNLYRG